MEKERKTQHTQGHNISNSKPQSLPSTKTTSVVDPVPCFLESPTYSPSTEQCIFVHVCMCVGVDVSCMQEHSHMYSGVPEKNESCAIMLYLIETACLAEPGAGYFLAQLLALKPQCSFGLCPHTPFLGFQMCLVMTGLYMHARDLNLGPHGQHILLCPKLSFQPKLHDFLTLPQKKGSVILCSEF